MLLNYTEQVFAILKEMTNLSFLNKEQERWYDSTGEPGHLKVFSDVTSKDFCFR